MKPLVALFALILLCAASLSAQQPAPKKTEASPSSPRAVQQQDWAPQLLYTILNSSGPQAGEELFRAAFAAGPAVIPELGAALKDDRTASFAAQALAFIGGPKALTILSGLAHDSRNLDLRQFYYGALGEFSDPQATEALLNEVGAAAKESDRSVAETAIIALTVHTDAALAPKLREMAKQAQDVVIQDDLENAADVIEARAKYLATPAGEKAGGSINQAVRTYFIPAFEDAPLDSSRAAESEGKKRRTEKPPVNVRIENLTLSPDGDRALAHVIFETPEALANYEMVLQKKLGNWTLASVWLGAEAEKPAAASPSGE